MKWVSSTLATIILASVGFGQTIVLPDQVKARPGAWAVVPAKVDGGAAQWYLPDVGLVEVPLDILFGPDWAKTAKGKVYTSDKPGSYRVVAWTAKGDVASPAAICTVVIEGPIPDPTPGPGPGPGPGPAPGPAPIPGDGLRVLMVYETGELGTMPAAQASILRSMDVRSYLQSHCVKGTNSVPEWRIWDKDVDTKNEPQVWKDAMARKRTGNAWIIISNGKAGFEGPLPADPAAALNLLKQYGGQ